jgi:Uri superfamily endonuclease
MKELQVAVGRYIRRTDHKPCPKSVKWHLDYLLSRNSTIGLAGWLAAANSHGHLALYNILNRRRPIPLEDNKVR